MCIFLSCQIQQRVCSSQKPMHHARPMLPTGQILPQEPRNSASQPSRNSPAFFIPTILSSQVPAGSQHVNLCTYFYTNQFPFMFKKWLELSCLVFFFPQNSQAPKSLQAEFPILHKQLKKQKCPGTQLSSLPSPETALPCKSLCKEKRENTEILKLALKKSC